MKVFLTTTMFFALNTCISSTKTSLCNSQEWQDHSKLCEMADRAANEPEVVASEMYAWAHDHGLLVEAHDADDESSHQQALEGLIKTQVLPDRQLRSGASPSQLKLPVVFSHGMGDSCFNDGMLGVVKAVSEMLGGEYVVCIPTGDSQTEDTKNGYFLSMDANVDIFAAKIAQDSQLQNGFHAIGFSQGNNVIRGYIARYNTPVVNTFISVNGVNAGIGAVPYCRPELQGLHFSMCELLMEQASHRAYTEFAQKHSFQANYWRDPRPSMAEKYHKYSQLAVWNNEGSFNATLNENFAKTETFVWVLATQDGMVWPKEGEQWGAPDPQDPFNNILPMKETEWYVKDSFGLRTADEAKKNYFESFVGDHLQFKMEDLERWVHTYLTPH